jgi:hypothetical protein
MSDPNELWHVPTDRCKMVTCIPQLKRQSQDDKNNVDLMMILYNIRRYMKYFYGLGKGHFLTLFLFF